MKARGQVLVLLAIFFGVAVVAVLAFIGLSTLFSVRAHARQSLQIATSAGARQLDYAALGDGQVRIDEVVAIPATRAAFENALSLQLYGLRDTPIQIAIATTIEVHNEVPWTSPYSGQTHQVPTVVAIAPVPIRILLFTLSVRVAAEAEVNQP